MKAPCCLLGAAALPRPPEGAKGSYRSCNRWLYRSSSGFTYTYILSVWWVIIMLMMTSVIASGTQCPIRTDALDVESKAYVSPQVVEAVVQDVVVGGGVEGDRVFGGGLGGGFGGDGGGGNAEVLRGQPYTVTVSVSKVLRRYRGPSRVKKRATLNLTFRYPSLESSDSASSSAFDSDSSDSGQCLVSAILRPRRKYILFLSGDEEEGKEEGSRARGSSKGPVPVAPPELASKKIRRLVRRMVCKKCGGPPTVTGPRDDSVVRDYNLTLECTAQGNPAPTVHWYKDDILLTNSRNIKIKTRKRRRKMIIRGRGTRTPRHSLNPFISEAYGKRRIRRRRRGGGGETGADVSGPNGGTAAAGTKTEKKRRIRGGRGREDNDRRRLPARRRLMGGSEFGAAIQGRRGGGEGGGGGGGERRRRPEADRSFPRSSYGDNSQPRSEASRRRKLVETSNNNNSNNNNNNGNRDTVNGNRSSSTSSSSNRRQQTGDSRRNKSVISSLSVRSVVEEDAGVYKCVAKSVAGEASSQARIRVVPPIDPHIFVDKCPYSGYCLNGGTCMMFKIVGELVCQCAEGFKGQRCEEKEVYPTFRRDCHGPLRHIRHSHGLRCPRNQPTALWELLQQSLARSQKVPSWSNSHLLNWSPTHTRHVYWPYLIPSTPQSTTVQHQSGALAHGGSHPPGHSVMPKTTQSDLNTLQSTPDPVFQDSIFPHLDHSQIIQWKDQLESFFKISSSPVQDHRYHKDPEGIPPPVSASSDPLAMKQRPETSHNTHRNLLTDFPPTQPYNYREDELVQPTFHYSRKPHHQHRHHSSRSAGARAHDNFTEIIYPTESIRLSRERKLPEVKLPRSSETEISTTPLYPTTLDQDNLQK